MQKVQSESVATKSNQRALPVNMVKRVLLTLAALLVFWLLVKAWVIGSAARSLLSLQGKAEALLAEGVTELEDDAVEALILEARSNVLLLKSETAVFLPLLTRLGWVPKYGPTLEIAPHLLDMADAGTETAAYAFRGLKPALNTLQSDVLTPDQQISQLLLIIDSAEPDLHQALLSLHKVSDARRAIGDVANQPWRVRSLLRLSDEWLPVAHTGLTLLPVVPELAGIDAPKHYLLLAQNEDELRATGGFISSAGILTVENGRIINLTLADPYQVDDFSKPYADPPPQLYDVMGLELFVFRDANFWPDFPTSAEQSMALYSYGVESPPLDGAIAINQQFLQTLLQITGPLPVADLDATLDSDSVLPEIRSSYGLTGDQGFANRKNFIGSIATAVQEKLMSDFGGLDPVVLASETVRAATQKELQIYARDPEINAVLHAVGWDGRLTPPNQSDYLLIVDQNMGFNKANLYVEKDITYAVTLHEDLTGTASLQINYFHNGAAKEPVACTQTEIGDVYFADDTNYETLANLCYWNYIRVYTPQDAALLDSSLHEIPAEALVRKRDWSARFTVITDLAGWRVFGNLIRVPLQQSETVFLRYQLPQVVQETEPGLFEYRLQLIKQAGTPDEEAVVQITLPEGYGVVESNLPVSRQLNDSVFFATAVSQNRELIVRFAKKQ